jgi:Tol biopolymer transport system component
MRSDAPPSGSRRLARATALCLLVVLSGCGAPSDSVTPSADGPASNPPTQPVPIQQRLAFVSNRDGSDYIYIADSSGIRRLTAGAKPTWSPDGRRLAFHRSGVGVYVINADGTGDRLMAPNGWNAAWSPDGLRIAYNTGVGATDGGIHLISADGSTHRTLVRVDFVNSYDWLGLPAWSPDGRSIAFVRANYEEPWQVYIVSAAGGTPRPLFGGNFIPSQAEPAWSPDGATIAFEGFRSIARVDTAGTGLRIHGTAGFAFDPDWSPDGRSLVFHKFSGPAEPNSPFGGRMRIYIADVNDGPVRQLIPEAINPQMPNYWDHQAAWLRAGR